MKKVIGVVGMPASGKGEFSRIAEEMGIPVVVMGDVIRRRVREEGLEPNDVNTGMIGSKLREELGMDAIAQCTIPMIEEKESEIVLVDGIRGDYEVETFRKHFDSFVLIGVDAPIETRLSRLMNRGRSDDTTTIDELRTRDEREKGWGIGRAIGMADIMIENKGSLPEFESRVKKLLNEMGAGK